ncbi:hypothetical protein M407DRAFT_8918 [Tulasnella calospora MUT 4182]|uniref:Uncharacterized protein n=1 Tax=Tulasnella calospora MUT 4182 TaxID=1051891 RepID=A0A0C3QEW3_9AGAM|nr:hypothetical protein M407DRAFT_8918 [Tulasnella calospora MUT 4182]
MSAFQPEPVDQMVQVMMMESGSTYHQLRRLDTGCPIWVSATHGQLRRVSERLECPVVVPPRLQELSLRGRRSRNWVTAFPEPLGGLKSLCLVKNPGLVLSDVLNVLAKLPNLETLVIQDCATQQAPAAALSTVTLPNLTTLQYIALSDKSIASMQQSLLSPNLTSLKVWYDYDITNWPDRARPLGALLQANPRLESLDLCGCVIEQPGWGDTFGEARSLKYLRLLSCESENNNLKALLELAAGEGVEQDFLPHLEHLVLDNVFHLTTKDIRRMVTHRPVLRFLELRGWDGSNVADDDVQFIRQSVECLVLETFYKEPGALEEHEHEENEEWSSTGTPSEGSWLSGDEEQCLRPAGRGGAGR